MKDYDFCRTLINMSKSQHFDQISSFWAVPILREGLSTAFQNKTNISCFIYNLCCQTITKFGTSPRMFFTTFNS